MSANDAFHIVVLPGDGVGREVMEPCLATLDAAAQRIGGFTLRYEQRPAGAMTYRDTGQALPATTMEAARRADAILLGAMGWPEIRYPDGTEIAPQLDLRFELELFAGVRPVRPLPGLPPVLAAPRAVDIDFVIVRESTEGLFASRGKGVVDGDREARDTMVISRRGSERLFDFSFALARARQRAGRGPVVLTCVDKANVFASFAYFRKIFDERGTLNSDIKARHAYVDAMAQLMVSRPWDLDVLVTENMFGDILSDLGAALMGGMGFAPSADIGERHAVFQPCHGTAPDITGQGKANPTAMILSAAMMLDWLADKHGRRDAAKAAALIRHAVDHTFRAGLKPYEIGGQDGTQPIARAVVSAVKAVPLPDAS